MSDRDMILCLCDLTGAMAAPWIENRYRAILIDPQHGETRVDGAATKIAATIDSPAAWEVIRHNMDRIAFVAAFPPCTELAVSGARWFAAKSEADPAFQYRAMQVVWQCHVIAEMIGVPWFIENPVSRISTFWRRPDFSFHPWHYAALCPADHYVKKTCLWTGGGFVMPERSALDGADAPDDRIHKCPPGPERANIRSATPLGFARAVFNANGEADECSSRAIGPACQRWVSEIEAGARA